MLHAPLGNVNIEPKNAN